MSDKSEACPVCGMPVGMSVDDFDRMNEAGSTAQQNNNVLLQTNQLGSNQTSSPLVQNIKKKSKTGLVIGVAVVLLAIIAIVALLVFKGYKKRQLYQQDEVDQNVQYDQSPQQSTQNTSKLVGHEWLEGVWAGSVDPFNFARMIVTDSYIQIVNSNTNNAFDKVEEMHKEDYQLTTRHAEYVSGESKDIFGFDEFIGVDDNGRYIYIVPGQYTSGVVLHKIQSYTFESAVLIANTQYPPQVFSNAYDGFVNIRQTPSGKAPILGVLKNGPDGAVLLSREGSWTKDDYHGIVGYVASQYIQDTPTEVFNEY